MAEKCRIKKEGAEPALDSGKRVEWIDTAKALGILLVFYGHFAERLFYLKHPGAHIHYKFVYSFHIPLFFLLSGYVAGKKNPPFKEYMSKRFFTLVVPALFFNFLAVPFWIYFRNHDLNWYLINAGYVLKGFPRFNIVVWFLICLFSVHFIHLLIGSKFRSHPVVILIMSIAVFSGGHLVLKHLDIIIDITGLPKNFWFLHEAVIGYGFFLVGLFLRNTEILGKKNVHGLNTGLFLVFLILTLATFDLNSGGFVKKSARVVLMTRSDHGVIYHFLITGIAGALSVIGLSRLMPANKLFSFIGQNSLSLLGLNGILLLFFNDVIARFCLKYISSSSFSVFAASVTVSMLSVAICLPFVLLLNKTVPFLVGKKKGYPG